MPRRIAIVGGGISGMAAAYTLCRNHLVTLIEAAPTLGGHARTITAGRHGTQPVDTGFIVFNKVNYPHLTQMFSDLDVPIGLSNMSFSASFDGGALEYSTRTVNTLFAQRRNLVRPDFLSMVRDIIRFSGKAVDGVEDSTQTVAELLDELGLGQAFRDYYLAPISGAIWSTPSQNVLDFPASAMIRFFRNHNLLYDQREHDWFTVEGGSVEYVRRVHRHLETVGVDLRLGTPVAGVRRSIHGPEIRMERGDWQAFDEVILATHSDVSLRLLSDPSPEEQALLSKIRYQPNTALTHRDPSVMPKRRKCWAAWNYTEPQGAKPDQIGLSYWMNRLQPSIPDEDPIFVTLNPQSAIRDDLIYDQADFTHPVYDTAMMDAVEGLRARNGAQRTWFCGAWMHNGFHEDGFQSAVDVAEGLARRDVLPVAAE